MITYNTKEWFSVFSLHKGDTFRKLFPLLVLISVYTAIIAFLELDWFHVSDKSYVRNIPLMHSLLGFAISMLLVFRTNTAYDRWWEGRKLWGSLVNTSRNMALKFNVMLPEGDTLGRDFFAMMIPRFAVELMQHLRSEVVKFELDEKPHPEIPDFDTSKHMPAQIASLIYGKATQMYRDGIISGEQLITVNDDMTALMDICGACERIRNTPIPYSYSVFIKKFIFVYVFTLPFGYVFSLDYLAVPVVAFIFFVLGSLEVIAEEIEEPFGTDSNDLPMERLCVTINHTVKGILEPV
jgi:ion channel-forming bestrophin family protein